MNVAAMIESAKAYAVPCRKRTKGTPFEESGPCPAATVWRCKVRTVVDVPWTPFLTGLTWPGSAFLPWLGSSHWVWRYGGGRETPMKTMPGMTSQGDKAQKRAKLRAGLRARLGARLGGRVEGARALCAASLTLQRARHANPAGEVLPLRSVRNRTQVCSVTYNS